MLKKAIATNVPGDGSCLFHAICYTLKEKGLTGFLLRDITANIIERHPQASLHGVSVSNWIEWDNPGSSVSAETYARKVRGGLWGGALEMTILASVLNMNIFVYKSNKLKECYRISDVLPDKSFLQGEIKRPNMTSQLCLLWVGNCHYMHLSVLT
jgi:hypothetical protein